MAFKSIGKFEELARMHGGRFARHYAACMDEVMESLTRMPAVENARKLTITLEFSPLRSQTGTLQDVEVVASIKVSKPNRVAGHLLCRPIKDGRTNNVTDLQWNDGSPDAPDQMTIDDLTEEQED